MKLTEKVMMILFIALMSFIAIDICSEIKKQDANIQRNLQEQLIDVETKSFAGKNKNDKLKK